MRDLLEWGTRTDLRVRVGSAFRLAFGLLVLFLGLTVFPAAEQRDAKAMQTQTSTPAAAADLPRS